MDEAVVFDALPKKDHQAALAIINLLGECQTRIQLNQVLKRVIIPLMDCSGVFYARKEGNQNSLQLLDDVNQSSLCQHSWKEFLEVATQTQLLASSVTSETGTRLATDAFCCTNQRFHQLNRCCAIIALFDAHKPTVALYFCRLKPQEQYYNVRDFELLQILRATLLQTIKAVMFQEESQNFRLMMDHLSDQAEPLALLRDNGVMMYKNHAFKQIVDQENFRYLSTFLSQTDNTISVNRDHHFTPIQLGRRLYEVTLKSVNDKENEGVRLYLLRFSRAYNKNGQILRQWRQAGLTHRELQIVALLYQGLSTRTISEQLYLSYHTVRNHTKHIYEKIGISTRSELLTWVE